MLDGMMPPDAIVTLDRDRCAWFIDSSSGIYILYSYTSIKFPRAVRRKQCYAELRVLPEQRLSISATAPLHYRRRLHMASTSPAYQSVEAIFAAAIDPNAHQRSGISVTESGCRNAASLQLCFHSDRRNHKTIVVYRQRLWLRLPP